MNALRKLLAMTNENGGLAMTSNTHPSHAAILRSRRCHVFLRRGDAAIARKSIVPPE
jgi:hypothetical protein